MLTILDLARLCGHVYQSNNPTEYLGLNCLVVDANKVPNALSKRTSFNWYGIDNIVPQVNSKEPFFARLYVNVVANRPVHAVVAFRGTELFQLRNDLSDIKLWESSLPYGYCNAITYFAQAQQFVDRHFGGLTIRSTGHSLGGALAQLAGIHKGAPTVSFNAPGIGRLPGVDGALNDEYYKLLIVNVNSREGKINKVGKLVGKEIKVDVPAARGIKGWYSMEPMNQHFIASMIQALSADERVQVEASY